MAGGVVIGWVSKTAGAVTDTDRLAKSASGVGDAAKKSGGVLGKLGKAAAGVGLGVGAVAVGATVAFVDMAKAAYEDANAQKLLERNLGRVKGVTKKAAAATGDWVDQMELATLISDGDLREALSRLTLATGDLSDAQKLAVVAQDAAVGSGKEFAGVAGALAKAADGNTAALKKQFPWLDAGADKTLTLAEAVGQLEDKFGGAAKAAADNDVFGRLGVAWGQISEAIGTAALPVLEDISAWFGDKANVAKIEGWIGQLETWAQTVGEKIRGKIEEFVTWLKSDAGKQAIKDITGAVEALGDALETVVGWLNDFKTGMEYLIDHGWGTNPNLPNVPKAEPPGTHLNPDQNKGARPGWQHNAAAGYTGGGTVVNIYNPKPERATVSVASALRVSRPNTVSV